MPQFNKQNEFELKHFSHVMNHSCKQKAIKKLDPKHYNKDTSTRSNEYDMMHNSQYKCY